MKKIAILLSVLFLMNSVAFAEETLSAADAAVIKAENEALKKKLAALESAKKQEAKAPETKLAPAPKPVVGKTKSDIKESFDTEVDESKDHVSDARKKFKERAKEKGFLSGQRTTPPAAPKTVRQSPTKTPTATSTQSTQRPVVVAPKENAPTIKAEVKPVEQKSEIQEEKKSDSVWDSIFPF